MALLEAAVRDLRQEQAKTRGRLHKVEPAQRTLLDLVKLHKQQFESSLRELSTELRRDREALPGLVQAAIAAVLEHGVRTRREGLSVHAQLASVAIAFSGTTAAIVLAIVK
jgi:hypothetical protein